MDVSSGVEHFPGKKGPRKNAGLHRRRARRLSQNIAAMNNTDARCPWPVDELYIAYHDTEWGVPLHDDRALFEFLVLEGAQAGLSWHIVLKKRENYRAAFDQFDPQKVARYTPAKIAELLANPGIIRNRLKIAAAVRNARAFLAVQEEFGRFDRYIWRFVGGQSHHQPLALHEGSPRPHRGIRRHEPGPETARFQIRRFHHLLRPHAGHRHGQRPFGRIASAIKNWVDFSGRFVLARTHLLAKSVFPNDSAL